jgi:hypothetical protein
MELLNSGKVACAVVAGTSMARANAEDHCRRPQWPAIRVSAPSRKSASVMTLNRVPLPATKEAIAKGCTCPPQPEWPMMAFASDCPLHQSQPTVK